MNSKTAQQWMRKAVSLARRATGRTHPNPMVGCVVVKGGKLVGQGYHRRAGTAHAEVVALQQAGVKARGADVFVTLEPCCHHGRTGPCVEVLKTAKVRRVFVGTVDPDQRVSGGGIKRLKRAGIEVVVGVLGAECIALNDAYFHFSQHGVPWVEAKLASSLDGCVATRTRQSQWITGDKARAWGHRLRHQADAMVVGIGTVVADNPTLTCRLPRGVDPIRIVLDTLARTPVSSNVLQIAQQSTAPTWIITGSKAPAAARQRLERAGAEVLVCRQRRGRIDLSALMQMLAERDIVSVLLEGGPTLMGSFFDADLVRKVHAVLAPIIIGGAEALHAVGGQGPAQLYDAHRLERVAMRRLGEDFALSGYVPLS